MGHGDGKLDFHGRGQVVDALDFVEKTSALFRGKRIVFVSAADGFAQRRQLGDLFVGASPKGDGVAEVPDAAKVAEHENHHRDIVGVVATTQKAQVGSLVVELGFA